MVFRAENADSIGRDSEGRNGILLDENNFRQLFNDHYSVLCKYSLRIVRRSEIAEEIVQDQFIYIWKNKDQLHFHNSFQSYLYRAVKNKSIDYLRSRFAMAEYVDDSDIAQQAAAEDPSSGMEMNELQEMVSKAVFLLPEKCHTIFTMSRFGEMKNQEIADSLDISIKTVENQITIAIKKLKAFLDKHWMIMTLLFSLLLKWK
jgi:RNA polymerase sigma-70 factor, ECF subfamily